MIDHCISLIANTLIRPHKINFSFPSGQSYLLLIWTPLFYGALLTDTQRLWTALPLGGIPKSGTFCLACFDLSKFRKSAPVFQNLLHFRESECVHLEKVDWNKNKQSRYPELGQSKQAKQKVPDFGISPSVTMHMHRFHILTKTWIGSSRMCIELNFVYKDCIYFLYVLSIMVFMLKLYHVSNLLSVIVNAPNVVTIVSW